MWQTVRKTVQRTAVIIIFIEMAAVISQLAMNIITASPHRKDGAQSTVQGALDFKRF